jgi:pimeloyl-ACP methyl ester carboxylesterase
MSSFVLVHGGFGGGWVWDDVASRLASEGHGLHVIDQLPSAGTDPSSLGDMAADADHVRRVLDETDEPAVLVGHSYSGMVITELADHPKVRHSVYLTAVWPQRGQSMLNLMGDELPPAFFQRDDGAMQITDDFDVAWETFCPDLDRGAAAQMVTRSVLQSYSSATTPSTAPDRRHPATYLIATGESDESVDGQEALAAGAEHVTRIAAGHMAQLSRPNEVAAALTAI